MNVNRTLLIKWTHTHTYFYLVSDFIWSAVCWFDVPKFSQGFCSVSEYDVISKCMVLNCETAKFLSQQKGLKWWIMQISEKIPVWYEEEFCINFKCVNSFVDLALTLFSKNFYIIFDYVHKNKAATWLLQLLTQWRGKNIFLITMNILHLLSLKTGGQQLLK